LKLRKVERRVKSPTVDVVERPPEVADSSWSASLVLVTHFEVALSGDARDSRKLLRKVNEVPLGLRVRSETLMER
jgi:hypothetical protein